MHPEPTLYVVTTPAGTAFTTYSAALARAHAALGACEHVWRSVVVNGLHVWECRRCGKRKNAGA